MLHVDEMFFLSFGGSIGIDVGYDYVLMWLRREFYWMELRDRRKGSLGRCLHKLLIQDINPPNI